MNNSDGQRPSEQKQPKTQALQGRHPDSALAGLGDGGDISIRRAMPCAID